MTVKLKRQVSSKYYDEFKNFVRMSTVSTKSIVEEIKRYYDHYVRWKNADNSTNPIDVIISSIKKTGQNKVTPVILQVLDDLKNAKCTVEQAKKILTVIEAYWWRRMICGLPSNTAGAVCFTMQKNLGKANYADDFIKCIFNLTWAQRMPDDTELKSLLHEATIYGKGFDRLLLDKMEMHENKDYAHSSNHSIEHVMPQTVFSHDVLYARTDLSDEKKEKLDWATDLGNDWEQIHNKYLNTIGNLTLTGFNSEYQNYRFSYKKNMTDGYSQSPIRLTSKSIAVKEKWGADEIIERADKLAEIIADIWKYPAKPTDKAN